MNHQQHILEALEMICCKFDSLEDVDLTHLIDDQSHLLVSMITINSTSISTISDKPQKLKWLESS